jgi:hypothetical protein
MRVTLSKKKKKKSIDAKQSTPTKNQRLHTSFHQQKHTCIQVVTTGAKVVVLIVVDSPSLEQEDG